MALLKPKAPEWLRLSFRDGVDERLLTRTHLCWLAQHDPLNRRCSGEYERFHYINRQRVENAMGAMMPDALSAAAVSGVYVPEWERWRDDLILLAAWDPRNGGIACEHHHRRLDSHLTPALTIRSDQLPDHVWEFAEDWGLESDLERRYSGHQEEAA